MAILQRPGRNGSFVTGSIVSLRCVGRYLQAQWRAASRVGVGVAQDAALVAAAVPRANSFSTQPDAASACCISIVAHDLAKRFDSLDQVGPRVGGLPQ